MSDIAQGAVIAMAGTILGALVTGIISYFIAKQQINASRETLYQQLKHKEQEALISNLIKAREKVLIPLREALGSSLALANNATILMVQMGEANKKPSKEELEKAIKRWDEAEDKSDEADDKLHILRNQITDPQLDQMIDDAITLREKENINTIALVMLAHEPESWDIEKIRSIKNKLNAIRKRIFDKLLPVNKRIEELLSGK